MCDNGLGQGSGNSEGGMTPSMAETELTKRGVSGTKINQTKSNTTIGNIVFFPVCAVNIPKVNYLPLGKLIVTSY